jgi:hypothetical protein
MVVDINTARQRAAERLLGVKHVVGVGVGQEKQGEQYLVVLVERLPHPELPESFEGYHVKVQVVGKVRGGPPNDEEE